MVMVTLVLFRNEGKGAAVKETLAVLLRKEGKSSVKVLG